MEGRVNILLGARSTNTRVELDGSDVTGVCQRVLVDAEPGKFAKVTLEIAPWLVSVRGDAEVMTKYLENQSKATPATKKVKKDASGS